MIQAKLTLPFEQADEVSDMLMELGALAVSLEDANADSEDEQPLFGEPGMEPESAAWNLNHVVALFRNKAEGEQVSVLRKRERNLFKVIFVASAKSMIGLQKKSRLPTPQ